jgi:hypothetical protein
MPDGRFFDYDLLNQAEIVELCRHNQLAGASRMVDRKDLLGSLLTLTPLEHANNPMRATSARMKVWLSKWWDRVRISAPKTCCPDCPGCSDLQVLDCYRANKHQMEPV